MENRTDVLVVGCGPAGIISALTARRYYPTKKITVMKDPEQGVIPCGIPYMFSSLKSPEENKLGTASLEQNHIEVVLDEALRIDRDKKILETQ